MISIDDAVKHGIYLRRTHHLGKLLSALPARITSEINTTTVADNITLRVPLSVIEHGG